LLTRFHHCGRKHCPQFYPQKSAPWICLSSSSLQYQFSTLCAAYFKQVDAGRKSLYFCWKTVLGS
jgi:hypothetical protein